MVVAGIEGQTRGQGVESRAVAVAQAAAHQVVLEGRQALGDVPVVFLVKVLGVVKPGPDLVLPVQLLGVKFAGPVGV